MQRPSYPKETADQWPPIAGDHTGWGGACNQSINTGRSLGEQYNLMRHTPTHTSPLIWFPPPPGLHLPPETLSSFLTLFISTEPQLQPNSPALLHCSAFLPPSSSTHPQWHLWNSRGTGCTKGRNAAMLELEKVERTAVKAVREIDGFWWVNGANYLPKSSAFDNCLTWI